MNIGGWIRENSATITAMADPERYEAIKVDITVVRPDRTTITTSGVGYSWSFDDALANAIAAVPPDHRSSPAPMEVS